MMLLNVDRDNVLKLYDSVINACIYYIISAVNDGEAEVYSVGECKCKRMNWCLVFLAFLSNVKTSVRCSVYI